MTELAHRGGSAPLVLGRSTFLYLAVTLVLISLLLIWAVFHPAVYHQWCVRYYIPSVEQRFGFRAGRIAIPDTDYRWLGVIEVTPGGVLSRAGFRPGDIPVDHHGGETAFCSALYGADDPEADGYRRVDVINVREWQSGRKARRELQIPRVQR